MSKIVSDLSEIPEVLSEEFLKKSVENGLNLKNIELNEIKISKGSFDGGNFTSTIYTIEIKYNKTETTSLIVKCLIQFNVEALNELQMYNKEIEMYTVVLPKLEKLYNDGLKFAPKYFNSINDTLKEVLVIEDLRPSGFTLPDRTMGLNEKQSRLVLQKLGLYHAATIILLKQEPNIFEKFLTGFYQASTFNSPIFQGLLMCGMQSLMKFLPTLKGYEKITEKLQKLGSNFGEKILACLAARPDDIRVLNHSDLWTNNILLKNENDEVIFIDFQACTVDSLGMDINSFLNTSVQTETLRDKREELLQCYYESFRNGLERQNYSDIPSWEAVRNEINKKEYFGFIAGICMKPHMTMGPEIAKQFNTTQLMDPNVMSRLQELVYGTQVFQEYVKYSLKRFDDLGLFD